MAKTRRVSRRSILASVSALAAQAPDPALETIRNCDAVLEKFKAIMDDPDGGDLADEASNNSFEAWLKLCEVAPTTNAGAAALASYMAIYSKEEGGADTAQEALTALAASLEKFAAGSTAAVPAGTAASDSDAELLRLDGKHDIAFARANERGLRDKELTKRCQDVKNLEYAIWDIPAQALAGLAVKARLVSQYFEPEPVDPLMQGIIASLVEDLLRMAGASPKPTIALPYPTVYLPHSRKEGQSHV